MSKCSTCIIVPLIPVPINECSLCGEHLCTRHLAVHFRKHIDDFAIHKAANSLLMKRPAAEATTDA